MTSKLYEKACERWYPLTPHPTQISLITDDVRFKVVPAGRRSGKTERAKRFLVKKAFDVPGDYFFAAPTRQQVKNIYWKDIKELTLSTLFRDNAISETELKIALPNGSSITLVGLDKPQRIEGIAWAGGIVDEVADIKDDAFEAHIAPALDTYHPALKNKAWCWLIGVPDGLNHFYKLAEYARSNKSDDWKIYTWKSAEILPPEIIDAARARMSAKQFKQEYEASFETASGKIYEDYSHLNISNELLRPHDEILWTHDFNYSPLSSAICVRRGQSIIVVDEIILQSAVALQAAQEFIDRYKNHENKKVKIYGDPAGKAGEKHGQSSNYIEIEKALRSAGWSVERRVKAAAPAIRDRQNAVRAKILSADNVRTLFVNPKNAGFIHEAFSIVQLKKGSSFIEEESNWQHVTTAVGYMIEYEFPIRVNVQKTDFEIKGSTNFWNSK